MSLQVIHLPSLMPPLRIQSLFLGQAIKFVRETMGLSQEELAFNCGLHPTAIPPLEKGRRKPRFDTLERIAEGLGVECSHVLALAEVFRIGAEQAKAGE
ncbi:MAG: helix-turn-helix domain-containing protein [Actinomycetota bacterium]|nr:helix-turn-helix domain-containing protein [Actinomycetota bacterium]